MTFRYEGGSEFIISIWDADGNLINQWPVSATDGENQITATWNGKDFQGNTVPDEAYTFTIEDQTGNVLYNPFSRSGGERVDITEADILLEENRISYRLPYPCRMLVRAGAKPGPLHKTIVDWDPRTAGVVNEVWNGLDDSGNIYVPRLKGFLITISGYKLPDSTVITKGNSQISAVMYQRKNRSKESISIAREDEAKLHNQYGKKLEALKTPKLFVKTRDGESPNRIELTDDDRIRLKFSLDPILGPVFTRERFEIMYFIDDEMFMEEGQAYMPYNFELKGSYLPEGRHLFTINVGNFTNQYISYTITTIKGEKE